MTSRKELIVGVALAFALAGVAWVSLPSSVQAGDAGEFSTVLLKGGIPHPSGYPFMRMLGAFARIFAALGLAPASAAALPCALLGAAGLWLAFAALRERAGLWISAFVALALACAPLVVRHVYDAEVWGPLVFFAGAYLFVFLREPPSASRWSWAWHPLALGVLLGLGVAHHLSLVLLTPLAVGAAWPERGRLPAILRAGALGVLGSALGLAVYFTLFVGDADPAAPGWRWGQLDSLASWWHHVSRADYGSLQLSLQDSGATAFDQWRRSFASVAEAVFGPALHERPWVGLVLLAAVGATACAALQGARRWAWAASLLLSAVFFPTLFDLDPQSPFAAWILERFDLLPALLCAASLALALAHLREALPRLAPKLAEVELPGFAWAALASLHLAWVVSTAWPSRPAAHDRLEAYAQGVLEAAAPASKDPSARAYVLGADDHRSFPILYVQEVLEVAPRVVYIDPALMRYDWYRARMKARHPELPMIPQPAKLVAALQALPTKPEVYLANVMSRQTAQLPTLPQGPLLRVLRPAQARAAPDWDAVVEAHLEAMSAARFDVMRAAEEGLGPDPWVNDAWGQVLDRHFALMRTLEQRGRAELVAKMQRFRP